MPTLEDPRKERFAQSIAAGQHYVKAYADAGYKASAPNACRLSKLDKVRLRITELLENHEELHSQASAEAIKNLALTKEWVIAALRENAEIALGRKTIKTKVRVRSTTIELEVTDRDASAANRSLELLGRELGMFIERSENLNTNYEISDRPMTEDEWVAQHSTAVH